MRKLWGPEERRVTASSLAQDIQLRERTGPAGERFETACKTVAVAAANGELATYYQSGPLEDCLPCPHGWWISEAKDSFFMFGLVDLVNPTTAGYPAEHSARLFVSKADIDSLVHSIETDAAGRQEASPPQKTEVAPNPPSREEGAQVAQASVAKKIGRPAKQGRAMEKFRDRLKRGVTKPNKTEEARAIVKEWEGPDPPDYKSVGKWIKDEYQRVPFKGGKLVRG